MSEETKQLIVVIIGGLLLVTTLATCEVSTALSRHQAKVKCVELSKETEGCLRIH